MTAAHQARAAAGLRRAVLLVALLALIAGFLGMHILSGSHGMHSQAPLSGTTGHAAGHAASQHPAAPAPAQDTHSGHKTDSTDALPAAAVTPAAVTVGGTDVPPSCVCQGGCAEKPGMHIGCTPSAAGATLGAPQPGAALPAARPWTAGRAEFPSGYAYLPGTPTPSDLSISRT